MSKNMQTKKNFYKAFWELYKVNDISRISVVNVTKHAGYNRSTFYEYFIDIYDLLDQLEQVMIDEFCEILNERGFTDGKFNGMEIYVQGFVEAYQKYGDDLTVLLGKDGDPAFSGKIVDKMKDFWSKWAGNEAMNVEIIIEFACPALLSIMSTWHDLGKSIPIEQLMNVILKMIRAVII